MPQFRYESIDAEGRPQSGLCNARSLEEARVELTRRGLRILDLHPAAPAQCTEREAAELAGHIAQVAGAGLPLEAGLEAIAEDLPLGRMRVLMRYVIQRMESGESLETALQETRAPNYLRVLARAGLATGRLDAALEQLAAGTLALGEVRQTIFMALAYPVLALGAWCLLVGFILFVLVPQFEEMFRGFGLNLPLATEWLLLTSAFLRDWGWQTALAVALLAAICFGLVVLISGKAGLWGVVHAIPGVGPLVRSLSQCRFAQLLSLLVAQRVPLPEALLLSAEVSGDPAFAQEGGRIAAAVARGESLEEAALRSKRFSSSFVRALTWPAGTDGLPEMLIMLSEVYAGRVRVVLSVVTAFLPPLLLLLIGSVTLFTIVALFWPLFQMLNKLV
jgi:general secretion pathway protein F